MNDNYDRILEYAQSLLYQERYDHTWHSDVRMQQRDITDDDVEAAIQSTDSTVIEWRADEGTYTILGRRVNGDMIKVAVAFNTPEPVDASQLRIVSVMHPEQGDVYGGS